MMASRRLTADPMTQSPWLGRAVLVAFLLLPIGASWFVVQSWSERGRPPVTGDEPHYLIIADAIARDHSLRVKDAYDRDAQSPRIAGPIDWQNHTHTGPKGTFSIHGIGLGFLIAPGFAAFGLLGARITLVLIAGLLPILWFAVARLQGLRPAIAAALAVVVGAATPFVAAAGQIFPDLPSGVLVLGVMAALVAADSGRDIRRLYPAAGLALALLPWLHIKNIGVAVVLAVATVVLIWSRASKTRTFLIASAIVPFGASLALLLGYNHFAFGSPFGIYDSHAVGATFRQGLMIALGLHLDQAQGVFVQQPLFLLALPGWALFFLQSPRLAAITLVAYLAILVPNAMHPCWYGCWSFSGRFMWSAAPLWFLPLVALARWLGQLAPWTMAAACAASLAWQRFLMGRWLPNPDAWYTVLTDGLLGRNSLVELHWRPWLPSFYDFARFDGRLVNLVGVLLIAALLLLGIWLAFSAQREKSHVTRRLFPLLVSTPILLSILVVSSSRLGAAFDLDLVANFADAEKRPVDANPDTFAVESDLAPEGRIATIRTRAPSRLTWTLQAPTDAVFETRVRLVTASGTAPKGGIRFRVGVADETGYHEHVNRVIERGQMDWVSVLVDLSPYSGRNVAVILNTESARNPADVEGSSIVWAQPRIRSY